MASSPIYLGEFLGRTGPLGHLSTQGIFGGGAGYILGHKLLTILNSREIRSYGFELMSEMKLSKVYSDAYRSSEQMLALSVLKDGWEQIHMASCKSHCVLSSKLLLHSHAHHNTGGGNIKGRFNSSKLIEPLKMNRNRNLSLVPNNTSEGSGFIVIPLAVRLIEFCSNLMANEHTCQHRCQ
jgi:hypothetical protein